MPVNEFAYNLNTVKYTDNDLSSLKTVKIYDKDGKLKETITAELLTEYESYGKKKSHGERECRACHNMFTIHKRKQKTCDACIEKRPFAGDSIRRKPLKSEKI